MLAVIVLAISIGIGAYFTYSRWHLLSGIALKQQFNELINGKSQTNRDQKSNLLFLQRHDQSQKFRLKLVKNRQKALQRD